MTNMNKCIIIAEAGVNHNGELSRAKDLIKIAAEAGVDYVKFQTFKAEKVVSKKAKKAKYQLENTEDDFQYEMIKKLEIPETWYSELIEYAKKMDVKFLSTGFDEESIDFLNAIEIDLFKIPSGEITNRPYLEHIATKKKPVIISTGMANMQEVVDALDVLQQKGINKDMITVLHCNSEYPTPMKDVNLMAMLQIKNELGVEVGYSDHTLGVEVPIAAVTLGAKVIEKHFTLDRNLPGPDHKASLEPDELKNMVDAIRNIELALSGSGIKEASKSEIPNKKIARKSMHLAQNVHSGELICKHHISMIRPGDGISPMEIYNIIGKTFTANLDSDTKLEWIHIK